MVRLHFGRSFGTGVEVLWVITGLAPCVLLVTGALMWWNRVIRRTMGRAGESVGQSVGQSAQENGYAPHDLEPIAAQLAGEASPVP